MRTMLRLYAVPSEKLRVWMVWLAGVVEITDEWHKWLRAHIDLIARIVERLQMAADRVPGGRKIESTVSSDTISLYRYLRRMYRINVIYFTVAGIHLAILDRLSADNFQLYGWITRRDTRGRRRAGGAPVNLNFVRKKLRITFLCIIYILARSL